MARAVPCNSGKQKRYFWRERCTTGISLFRLANYFLCGGFWAGEATPIAIGRDARFGKLGHREIQLGPMTSETGTYRPPFVFDRIDARIGEQATPSIAFAHRCSI
jgi:hypothetical protein